MLCRNPKAKEKRYSRRGRVSKHKAKATTLTHHNFNKSRWWYHINPFSIMEIKEWCCTTVFLFPPQYLFLINYDTFYDLWVLFHSNPPLDFLAKSILLLFSFLLIIFIPLTIFITKEIKNKKLWIMHKRWYKEHI